MSGIKGLSIFDAKGLGDALSPSAGQGSKVPADASAFKEVLSERLGEMGRHQRGSAPELKFSNHAMDRIRQRGLSFSKEDMVRLQDAVDKAQAKGSKDSLIIMDDRAMIVSVKDKTVVTVMSKEQLKENVFTKIDSTIMI